MDITQFYKVLAEIIDDWDIRGLSSLVPVFKLENEELGLQIDELDYAESYTDAIEFLETMTESTTTFYVEDWIVDYEHVKDIWIFSKKMDYKDIVIDSHNRKQIVKEKLLLRISKLNPRVFEKLLIYLFESIPGTANVFVQPQTYDGGFEFTAVVTDQITRAPEWLLIQAKQQKNAVSVGQVRELIGTLSVESNKHRGRKYRGLMVSSTEASLKAREAARDAFQTIDFLTHEDVVDLMVQNKLGWNNETLEFWALDENFWDDLEGRSE